MTVAWSDEDRRGIYWRGLAIRAFAAGVFAVFFVIVWWGCLGAFIPALGLLLATLSALILVNPVMWWIGERRGFPLSDFRFHWSLDVLAVTLIVYCLGVLDVPITPVGYMIMIVSSATFATMAHAMWLATWASVCFALLVGGEEFGIIPHQHVEFATHLTLSGKIFVLGASVVLFYVFGYLGGTLATQLRSKTEEVLWQKKELEGAYAKEHAAREGMVLLSTLVQHDVYSPLSAVSGACRQAVISCKSGDLPGAGRFISMIDERLQSIESAVKTLGLLADDNGETEHSDYNLREVVEELVSDLRADCAERGISVSISGIWPLVRVSRERIYHVLRNLLTNSIKSVDDDGRGRIAVTAAKDESESDRCRVSVSDNGPGLPEDTRQRLMELHVRKLGPPRSGGGFGAGLALSRNLIQNWGGSLSYTPNQGGGSVFTVSVPARLIEGWL